MGCSGESGRLQSEGPPQHLKQRLKPDLVSSCHGLDVSRRKLWPEAVGIALPQGMGDNLHNISATTGLKTTYRHVLPTWLCREVRASDRGVEPLPVGDREVDWRSRVEGKPCNVQSEAPIKNRVVGQIAEVPQTVGARCSASIGTWPSVLPAD